MGNKSVFGDIRQGIYCFINSGEIFNLYGKKIFWDQEAIVWHMCARIVGFEKVEGSCVSMFEDMCEWNLEICYSETKKKCASLVECVKRYKGRIVMYLKKLIYRKTMQ